MKTGHNSLKLEIRETRELKEERMKKEPKEDNPTLPEPKEKTKGKATKIADLDLN